MSIANSIMKKNPGENIRLRCILLGKEKSKDKKIIRDANQISKITHCEVRFGSDNSNHDQ